MHSSSDLPLDACAGLAHADALPEALSQAFLAPEEAAIARVRDRLDAAPLEARTVERDAHSLAAVSRARAAEGLSVESFLREYALDSEEGVLLMCLAESLLRIPDDDTARLLVEDKLGEADFTRHLGRSDSLLVNASTWGLLLSGRLFQPERTTAGGAGLRQRLRTLFNRLGEGVALRAIRQAMELAGGQFVLSESIEKALARVRRDDPALRYSFDMLGEGAVSEADAQRYAQSYLQAIEAVGALASDQLAVSIKLSALDARYEPAQWQHCLPRLERRLRPLLETARRLNVQLTVDAEEAARLHLSLALFARLFRDPLCRGWGGFGLAVQAYQKRAPALLDWLQDLARETGDRIPLRLVKGAYWDSEIKRAQVLGLADYPVFVHKAATDVSWLACADRILAAGGFLYGQFASHNAHSLSALLALARGRGNQDFEIQRLFGMGEALSEVLAERFPDLPQRVYAPVGEHQALLPYLMRRLLENGANSSFVHHLSNPAVPLDDLVRDPRAELPTGAARPAGLPLPRDLYGAQRRNAAGLNLDDERCLDATLRAIGCEAPRQERVTPLIAGQTRPDRAPQTLRCPFDLSLTVSDLQFASADDCRLALELAAQAAPTWRARPVPERSACLERVADAFEAERERFLALLIFEAGKTLPAALAELREAVDFCRYYAVLARRQFAPQWLPGPTGEENRLWLEGRGPFLAIAPWNFPLAIFTGQVAAALVAGNPVLAKPSERCPLVAQEAVRLFHAVGVPPEVLACLPASGEVVAQALLPDERLAGIAFTGSTRTARSIARALAERDGPFIPFIAETGGQNCMIVDSSALPEQVVKDVLVSAFDSAGQRCSALRVLYVQDDIADTLLPMLAGALALLRVGSPLDPSVDLGPVISDAALTGLRQGLERRLVRPGARLLAALPEAAFVSPAGQGHFLGPAIVESSELAPPPDELFGPLLQVVRFKAGQLDAVLGAIRASGYALTAGLHSRLDARARELETQLPAGNFYVNRNMVGAVVGVQPFGGFGLSGTGPKAGGPHYLLPFCRERSSSINTAAVGGDTDLLAGRQGGRREAGEPE